MHSDPISDMLTRIRNAAAARKQRVDIPASKVKTEIAKVLKKEGYINDFREISGRSAGHGLIEVKLRYDKNDSVIDGIKRVSKPGTRVYVGSEDIPKVRNGMGIMILTTSKGLMTDREARAAGIGGEALCAVW